jgi:glutamate synthase domain-containing protein 2
MINVGREALMSIGCVQALRCHTGHCPSGVATQNRWLMRGLDPELKSARMANYVVSLRKELLQLSRACGVCHPALVSGDHLEILNDQFGSRLVRDVFHYQPGWGLPSESDRQAIQETMSV